MPSSRSFLSILLVAICSVDLVSSWQIRTPSSVVRLQRNVVDVRLPTSLNVVETNDEEATKASAEETTEKYGLEAGLFQSLRQGDSGGESAKSLLKKYGVAYLATSIPLAIVSFAICYVLVDSGVDVASLLSKVGIEGGDAGEKAGTAAIAYAAHKAASPIRFPPTVMLTPVVAKLIGKEPEAVSEGEQAP
mmetsp:Transcript_35516/g.106042  ORF Transcript_35516/g.106042 Transcript_35516/m.106042 type:complete len:191 (-) Transcript_35516:338-910(-)